MLPPSERRRRTPREHRGRRFDVQPSLDDRSLDWPVRPLLTSMTDAPKAKAWRRGPVLDQGQEGACVGHGVVQELASDPVRVTTTTAALPAPDLQALAFWVYREAQKVDPWPGEAYSGTSLNAGMRVARSLGLIAEWRWVETFEDFRGALTTLGPILLTMPWRDGMYEAPGGVLTPSGAVVGWHCILANAWDLAGGGRVRLLNSWGTSWGVYGSAWIGADTLWSILADNDGEAVVPIGRTVGS